MTDETNMGGINGDRGQKRAVERESVPFGTYPAEHTVNAPSDRKNGVSRSIEAGDQSSLDAMAAETMGAANVGIGRRPRPATHFIDGVPQRSWQEHERSRAGDFEGQFEERTQIHPPKPGERIEDRVASRLILAKGAFIVQAETVAALTIKLADAEEEVLTQSQIASKNLERALLAESRESYWRGKYEEPSSAGLLGDVAQLATRLTDRGQVNDAILLDRMRTAMRHDREHAGKLEARVRVLTAERDSARELADQADGYLRRAEAFEQDCDTILIERDSAYRQLADMTTNRDALDEACKRKDKRIVSTEIERDTARDIAALFRETLESARDEMKSTGDVLETSLMGDAVDLIDAVLATAPGDMEVERAIRRSRDEFVQAIHKATPNGECIEVKHHPNGGWSVYDTPAKPRCRVVTSPRFYSEEDRNKSIRLLQTMTGGPGEAGRSVAASITDAVATALGMRRV